MKKVKKLISIILVIVLTLLLFPAYLNVDAANIGVKGENNDGINPNLIVDMGTITVSDVDSNDTFKAYKLLDAFYNEQTNEITYEFTDDFNSFLEQSSNHNGLTVDEYFAKTSGDNSGVPYTSSTLDILVSEYTTYVRNNNINGIDMTTSGTSATVTVPSGAYLVLPEQTMNVYAVMVGNVVYEVQDGNWELKHANIVAKKNDITHINFITTLEPEWLRENMRSANDAYALVYNNQAFKEKSFKLDEEYTNVIYAGIYYPTNVVNKKYKVEIEFDEGISVNEEEGIFLLDDYGSNWLTIEDSKIYKDNEVIGSCSVDNNKIIVEFTKLREDHLEKGVFILYRSSLNENAVVGGEGNKTQTSFTYANDPYDMNSQHTVSIEPTTVYTYGLKINNYGDEAKTNKLNGSVFEVYSDSDLSTKIGEVNINDGTGTFIGLAEGTYYVKHSKAAAGYTLLNEVLEVNIGNSSDYIEIDVINNRMWFLPSTGGVGTIIYTVIGLGIIGIASIFLVKFRKKAINM